ncbi:MAG: hypothetical protein RL701_1313, partial [Pseudomonadota bacterium]
MANETRPGSLLDSYLTRHVPGYRPG